MICEEICAFNIGQISKSLQQSSAPNLAAVNYCATMGRLITGVAAVVSSPIRSTALLLEYCAMSLLLIPPNFLLLFIVFVNMSEIFVTVGLTSLMVLLQTI
jgi:hypothetical protein